MSSESDLSLEEWKAARKLLNNYDDRLHDLRKVGFSFITGLLTVDALLTNIPDNWKLAALVATLFLIVPLDLVDRSYRVFLVAGALRAEILERRSRMDLTQAITRMFEVAHVGLLFELVYVLFVLVDLLLGWIIFAQSAWEYWIPVLVISISTVIATWLPLTRSKARQDKTKENEYEEQSPLEKADWLIRITVALLPSSLSLLALSYVPKIHYNRTLAILAIAVLVSIACILYVESVVDLNEWVDFSIDGYDYDRGGEDVLLTISNFGHDDISFEEAAWHVYNEVTPKTSEKIEFAGFPVKLEARSTTPGRVTWSDHRWLIPTADLYAGVYKVVYEGPNYHRIGRIFKHFKLIPPTELPTELRRNKLTYDPWDDAAQRFRVVERRSASAPAPIRRRRSKVHSLSKPEKRSKT